jgi:hypothetical protein
MILDMDDAAFESWLESWLVSHGQPGGRYTRPLFLTTAHSTHRYSRSWTCAGTRRARVLSAQTDRTYRLPTEHEWEAAARDQPAVPTALYVVAA